MAAKAPKKHRRRKSVAEAVFISYCHEDRAYAGKLVGALAKLNIECWWDHKLTPGEVIPAEVKRKLRSARAVVVIWSKRSLRSTWVTDEAAYSVRCKKYLPIRIDRCSIPMSLGSFNTPLVINPRSAAELIAKKLGATELSSRGSAMQDKYRIAIVDDEKEWRQQISSALRSAGFLVKCYASGATGLRALINSPPDLAVLDVSMPGLSGHDVIAELRKQSQLPVIFLTRATEEHDQFIGFKIGADDYIAKPFSRRVLVERVRAILRRADERE